MKGFIAALSMLTLGTGAASGAGASPEQLKAKVDVSRCEQPQPRRVVFSGDSAVLGDCLEKLGVREIGELRITSPGGDAWASLQTARAWMGRVDLLVVDTLCGSSCANYFIPMAKRVSIVPASYVVLHGAINPALFEKSEAKLRKDLLTQYRELNSKNPIPKTQKQIEAEFEVMYADALDKLREQADVQAEFERARLRCRDWLDPNLHLSTPIPDRYGYLLVTPVMAYRCLQVTQVESWPPPDAQKDLDPRLGFMRARR